MNHNCIGIFKGVLYLNGVKYGNLYQCEICGKEFIEKTEFMSNKLRIDEIAQYFCENCKKDADYRAKTPYLLTNCPY